VAFQFDPKKQGQFASREDIEAAFQQSVERLGFAMEAVTEGVWDWDVINGNVYCSPVYFRMLGYEPLEGLSDHASWIYMVHPDDRDKAWAANQACVDGQIDTFEVEFRMRHHDGTWRWVKSRGRCVARGMDGAAQRLVGTHTDITPQKEAESSLRVSEAVRDESEARYRVIFEKATNAIFIETLDGAVVDCNAAACSLYGYTREELLRLNAADLVTPEVAAILPVLFQQVLSNGGVFTPSLNRKKNGAIFPVEVNLQQVSMLGEPRIIVGIHDISARLRSEKVQAALYQISEAAQSVADLGELYQHIHTIIAGLMPATNFYIALFDEANNLLSYPYAVDELDPTPPPQKLRRGMTEFVLHSGQPLLATPEVYARLIEEGAIEIIGAPCVDWLGVPLKNNEQTIGVMALQTYTHQVRYTQADQDVLVFISSQIASVIQRRRAEEQIRKLNKTLHSISQINQTLVRAVDEQELMLRVCQLLVDSGDYPLVWIGLLEPDATQTMRPAVIAGKNGAQIELNGIVWQGDAVPANATAAAVRSGKPILR
jgi:PAS domain S-box-containing protein